MLSRIFAKFHSLAGSFLGVSGHLTVFDRHKNHSSANNIGPGDEQNEPSFFIGNTSPRQNAPGSFGIVLLLRGIQSARTPFNEYADDHILG